MALDLSGGGAPADARAPDPLWTTADRHIEPQLRSPLALVASPALTPLCVTTDAVFIAPGAAPPVPAAEPFPTSASFVFLARLRTAFLEGPSFDCLMSLIFGNYPTDGETLLACAGSSHDAVSCSE